MKKLVKRFEEIDILKGIAILCMITFHYYYYPTQLGIPGYNYKTTTLMITAKVAQVIFILCSGMNLSITSSFNPLIAISTNSFSEESSSFDE